MPPFPPPSHSPVAITLVIVIGALIALAMFFRWQHDRQRLSVLKSAIEKGLTHLPATLPMWLSSLRQGIMLATLGVALLIVGVIAVAMAHSGSMRGPFGSQVMRPWNGAVTQPGLPTRPPDGGPMGNSPPGFGGRTLPPPGGPLGVRRPIQSRNGQPPGLDFTPRGFGPPAMRFNRFPPPPGPRKVLGYGALAIGFILTLLGSVRIAFAGIERKYLATEDVSTNDSPDTP